MRLLVLPLALLLASCMFTSYPPGWPAMPKTAACASIGGTYANLGQMDGRHSSDDGKPVAISLSEVILERGENDVDKGGMVEIAAHGSGWTFRFLRDGALIKAKEFIGPLRCKGGWLVLSASGGLSSEIIVGHHHEELLLRKAGDGTLVLNHAFSAEGLTFMFLPTVAAEDRYMRFEPR